MKSDTQWIMWSGMDGEREPRLTPSNGENFFEKIDKENQLPIQFDKLNYQDHSV